MIVWSVIPVLALVLAVYKISGLFQFYYRSRHSGCQPCRSIHPWNTHRFLLETLRLRKPLALQPTKVADAPSRFQEVGSHTYSRDNGLQRVFVTADIDNIRASLGHGDDWGVEPMRAHAMQPFLGKGLLTTDGPIWRRSRTMLKPSLSKINVKDMSKIRPHIDRLVSTLPKDGSSLDVQPLLFRLVFILGRSAGMFLSSDQSLPDTYIPAFGKAAMDMSKRLSPSWFQYLRQRYWPDPAESRNYKLIHDIIDQLVEEQLPEIAKAEKSEKKDQERRQGRTMLESVSSMTDDRLEIRSQMTQGILASQDTIATFTSNILWLLARNPLIWQELRTQLLEIEDSPNLSDDLRKVALLQNVLSEALGRVALRDTVLPTGGGPDGKSKIFVPAGGRVIPYFYVLHRNTELFGDNPETFDPDRWSKVPNIQANFMAFGNGPRSCLGQDKALYEGSYLLWRFAQEFPNIKPGDDKEWDGEQYLTCQNKNGCHLAFPS